MGTHCWARGLFRTVKSSCCLGVVSSGGIGGEAEEGVLNEADSTVSRAMP